MAEVDPIAAPQDHAVLLTEASRMTSRADAATLVAGATAEAIRKTGSGLRLDDADLAGARLDGFDLRRASLSRTRLHRASLNEAMLDGATMICPGLERTSFRGASLRGAYLHALAAQVCDFTGASLAGVRDMTGALFHGCALDGIDLGGAVMSGTLFYQSSLRGAIAPEAKLQGCVFNESNLSGASFVGSEVSQMAILRGSAEGLDLSGVVGDGLSMAQLTNASELRLVGATLPNLRMTNVIARGLSAEKLSAPNGNFAGCDFHRSQFAHAALQGSHWRSSHLAEVDFEAAVLDDAGFFQCAAPIAVFTRSSIENLKLVDCSMPGASFRAARGRCMVARNCDLGETDFSDAYLYRCMITGDPPSAMRLSRARFTNAVLTQAYLTADATGACFRGSNLTYARLNQCDLSDADLTGVAQYLASCVKTNFEGATLSPDMAPMFTYRCRGMDLPESSVGAFDLAGFAEELGRMLTRSGTGST